jgi:hypothetical protein
MQTERKEKEGNVLAKQLGRAYDGLKQGPSRGLIITLSVILAVVLIVVLFRWFWLSSTAVDSGRWVKLDEVLFPDQLDSYVHDAELKDTPQQRLARFKEARMKLSEGIRDFANELPDIRDTALKNVAEATELYEKLSKESSRIPLLHQEALWGAAKGYETQGGGENIDKAKKLYGELNTTYRTSALGKDAKRQLERLNSPSNQKDIDELDTILTPASK